MTSATSAHPYLVLQQAIHDAVRRNLARIVAAFDRSAAPPPSEAAVRFWDIVSFAVHHHHETEDGVYWPLMRERRPELGTLFDRTEGEHAAILGAMQAFEKALAEWDNGGDVDGVRATIPPMVEAIELHLRQEEADVWPLIPELITQDDLVALQTKAQKVVAMAPERMLGFALEGAPDAILRLMETVVPAEGLNHMLSQWLPEWQRTVMAFAPTL